MGDLEEFGCLRCDTEPKRVSFPAILRSSHTLQSCDGIAVSVCSIEVLTEISAHGFAVAFIPLHGTQFWERFISDPCSPLETAHLKFLTQRAAELKET